MQKGNLFGVTPWGGRVAYDASDGAGVVFELSKQKTGYEETVLYTFCSMDWMCGDGAAPTGGLLQDARGNLLGTAASGGTQSEGFGSGVVFKIVPHGTNSTYSVQYAFCAKQSGTECLDGAGPTGGLALDAAGHLYGMTEGGGSYQDNGVLGGGTIFEIIGKREKVLFRFCHTPQCVKGSEPGYVRPILDSLGNVYGMTRDGVFEWTR
jgi:hypothetical protein